MHQLIAILATFLLASTLLADEVSDRFAPTKLSGGYTIDLPRTWVVVDGASMKPIEDMAGAVLDMSPFAKVLQGAKHLLTVGTIVDEDLVKLTILEIPFAEAKRETIASWSENAVKQFDAATQTGVGEHGGGFKAWHGTTQIRLGDSRSAVVSEYTRPGRTQEKTELMYTIWREEGLQGYVCMSDGITHLV